MVASEQFRPSPLVSVFDHGYQEVSRQVKSRGGVANHEAISAACSWAANQSYRVSKKSQLACNHRLGFAVYWIVGHRYRHHSRVPGPRLGGQHQPERGGPGYRGSSDRDRRGPCRGHSRGDFYNHFGNVLKEMGGRMDDFSLEFLNLIERSFGE